MKNDEYFQEPDYIEITAEKLGDDFFYDEAMSSLKYQGKTLVVHGTIESIIKDSLGDIFVTLACRNGGIKCKMFDWSHTLHMETGKKVKIIGVNRGYPQLVNCGIR